MAETLGLAVKTPMFKELCKLCLIWAEVDSQRVGAGSGKEAAIGGPGHLRLRM